MRREWDAARIYNFAKRTLDMNSYVTDERGTVVFDSDGGRSEGQDFHGKREVALTLAGQYGARSTRLDPKDADSSVMFVAAPIRRDGIITGVVSVSKARRSVFAFRDETRLWIRTLGLAHFAAVAVGAYLAVTLFSRPIRRLTAYPQAITRGGSGEAATRAPSRRCATRWKTAPARPAPTPSCGCRRLRVAPGSGRRQKTRLPLRRTTAEKSRQRATTTQVGRPLLPSSPGGVGLPAIRSP